jgi:hypothetical protein
MKRSAIEHLIALIDMAANTAIPEADVSALPPAIQTSYKLLRHKYNQYKTYSLEHPEDTRKPVFLLAFGTATGVNIQGLIPLLTGGVLDPTGGISYEAYSPERYQRRPYFFGLLLDKGYTLPPTGPEQPGVFPSKVYQLFQGSPYTVPRTNAEPKEARQVWPLANFTIPSTFAYVATDSYTPGMPLAISPLAGVQYVSKKTPNTFNMFFVPYNAEQPNTNTNLQRYERIRAQNGTPAMQKLIEGCEVPDTYWLSPFMPILDDIIKQGGAVVVYNDAWFKTIREKPERMRRDAAVEEMMKMLQNYYFEDMCEVPALLSTLPHDRVFRCFIEDPEYLVPLMESIPTDPAAFIGYNRKFATLGGRRKRTSKLKRRRRVWKRSTRKSRS